MLKSLKKISWMLLLVSGQQAAWAFALGGPIGNLGDSWQLPVIDYGVNGVIVAPKNIGEEYRLNSQVYYYACDASFLDFFGSDGANAIDHAFVILNSTMTNNSQGTLDGYSNGLTEFPFDSQSINGTASGLLLTDVKSFTMFAMLEQMGLANPERYVWCLHDRWLPSGGTCPTNELYLVIQRNYEITNTPLDTLQYSSFVNGTLYTYDLYEFCNAPQPPQAFCQPIGSAFTSVAGDNLSYGGFWSGLTVDDVAGLRYLLTTNNINFESPTPGAVLLSSTQSGGLNYSPPFPLFSSNYTAFVQAAQTNDPATLSNLFPGLVITSSSFFFTIQATPNIATVVANIIGAPAGSQQLVVVTNGFTYSVVTNWVDTFANVVVLTNGFQTNTSASLVTEQVQLLAGAPAGTLVTNTTVKKITLTNVPSGDYYINTNTCGPDLILSTLFTNVVVTTNLLFTASNSAGLFYSQSLVTYSTNHIFIAEQPICGAASGGTTTNSPGLYQGVGKIQFVKASFDSLLGQLFQPITNTYSMVLVSNSKLINQQFQRVVTVPDYTFAAADLASGPAGTPQPHVYTFSRNINFDQDNALPGLAGPGTIFPQSTLTYEKVGDIFLNAAVETNNPVTSFANQSLSLFNWGSFESITDIPVVYPNGTSIANLSSQILVQITPASLPNGTNGAAYPATTFVATGGAFSPPFTWSLPAGTGGLPPGLTLSSGGTISGTPTQIGTYDFTVQLTDNVQRTVQWNYSITIQ